MAATSHASFGFPYTYVRCSCDSERATEQGAVEDEEAAEEETFDPRDPRANYALYPLGHLMWCDNCHDMRCPRCTTEEIVCWYCPSCLFEVASGMVKSEGNRCTRNCHNCPVCTAPLSVNSLDTEAGGMAGPWILACDYCGWTTRDIDVQFDKPNNIYGQLARLYGSSSSATKQAPTGRAARATALDPDDDSPPPEAEPPKDHDARFKAMRTFYAQQLSKSSPADPMLSPSGTALDYSSPSSLARIMALYTGTGTYGKKAAKPSMMRAAITADEGLKELSTADDLAAVQKLATAGWAGTASAEQRSHQTHTVRFVDDLRPVPVLLRTKRSRRCRTCRHILVRPEAKVTSVRFRIKLVAVDHVPALTLSPLLPPATSTSPSDASPSLDLHALPPSRPLQFVLTVRNPLFDAISVTLATPATIPGHPSGRVTILCPQFDVDASTDVWDEALRAGGGGGGGGGGGADARRAGGGLGGGPGTRGDGTAEAGKVWERGRNWTSVVLEVVGPRLQKDAPARIRDEDVVEIPVSVRVEWESEVGGADAGLEGEEGEAERVRARERDREREKRELAFWCVLGVGKMARVDA